MFCPSPGQCSTHPFASLVWGFAYTWQVTRKPLQVTRKVLQPCSCVLVCPVQGTQTQSLTCRGLLGSDGICSLSCRRGWFVAWASCTHSLTHPCVLQVEVQLSLPVAQPGRYVLLVEYANTNALQTVGIAVSSPHMATQTGTFTFYPCVYRYGHLCSTGHLHFPPLCLQVWAPPGEKGPVLCHGKDSLPSS